MEIEKGLYNEVEKALSNKKIIKFLDKKSQNDHGIIIGKIEYFDDLSVKIIYGIMKDFEQSKPKIFSYEFTWGTGYIYDYKFKKSNFLPEVPNFAQNISYPSAKKFKESVEEAMQNPNEHWIDLSHFINFRVSK